MGPIINYEFKEKKVYENRIINTEELLSEIESTYSTRNNSTTASDDESDIMHSVLEIEYSTNYNVKSLLQIMDFYELNKKNMRKDELVQTIVLFETDYKNIEIVNRRRCMWNYMNELKRDKYFNKFILF